jgi:outer membrane protein TolC
MVGFLKIRLVVFFISVAIILIASASFSAQNPTTPRVQPAPTPPVQNPSNPPNPSTGQPSVRPTGTPAPSGTPQTRPSVTPPPQPSASPGAQPNQAPGQNVGDTGKVPSTGLPTEPPPIAPNFEAPVRLLPSAERVGVDLANQLTLTLDDAIRMALQNNNNIDISRNDVQIAGFNLKAARGVFDPLFASENHYRSATTPTASTIGGAVNGAVTQTEYFGSAGLSGFSPKFGGQYSTQFDSSRTNTSSTNALLNPQFPTTLTFNYTQPLFRNLRIDNNRRQIQIGKKNVELSDAQFRQQAITVVNQVEQAYWTLVYALRNLQVQIDAVKQARQQLESNQRQVEKGVLAPIEIIASTAQITTFEQSVYTAQEDVTRAENTLKTLLLPDRTAPEWSQPITPTSPVDLEPPSVGLEVSIAEALKNRPEIEQLEKSADINRIDQRYFHDQTKPQIDLVGSYTTQGLAGTPTARAVNSDGTLRVPAVLIGGYSKSLGNLLARDFPTYQAGITISLPLGNRVAKANLGRTLVEGDRIQNQLAQTRETVEAEVRNAIQALRSSQARLASAAASRDAAEKLYESEQRQFRAGTSTLYLVLQRQTNLINARGLELQAQTDLNRAISEFHRATGTTLPANNIEVSPGAQIDKK